MQELEKIRERLTTLIDEWPERGSEFGEAFGFLEEANEALESASDKVWSTHEVS